MKLTEHTIREWRKQLIEDLDVATHQKGYARRGLFHGTRGATYIIQSLAIRLLQASNWAKMAIRGLARQGKTATLQVIQFPSYARKIFFPKEHERVEKLIEQFTPLLEGRSTRCEDLEKLSHSDKELLLNEAFSKNASSPLFQNNMRICAEGIEPLDVINRAQVDLEAEMKQTPSLRVPFEIFIKAFDNERKAAAALPIDKVTPSLVAKMPIPALLQRTEVQQKIESFSTSEKRVATKQLEALKGRLLTDIHNTETQYFERMFTLLTPPDEQNLINIYTPQGEYAYLQHAINEAQRLMSSLDKGTFAYQLMHYQIEVWTIQQREVIEVGQHVQEQIQQLSVFDQEKRKEALFQEVLLRAQEYGIVLTFADDTISPIDKMRAYLFEIHKFENELLKELDITHLLRMRTVNQEKIGNELFLSPTHPLTVIENLSTAEKRRKDTTQAIAQKALSLALETHPECLMGLKIAGRVSQQAPVVAHGKEASARAKIERSAGQLIETLTRRYLPDIYDRLEKSTLQMLYAIENDSATLQGQVLAQLWEQAAAPSEFTISPVELAAIVQPDQLLSVWYNQLQDIWLEHMPEKQVQQIMQAPKKERSRLKAQLFNEWMKETVGYTLAPAALAKLSFARLRVEDTEESRDAAIHTIQQALKKEKTRVKFNKFIEKTRQNIKQKNAVHGPMSTQTLKLSAADFESPSTLLLSFPTQVQVDLPPFGSQEVANFIADNVIQALDALPLWQDNDTEAQENYIQAFYANPILVRETALRPMMLEKYHLYFATCLSTDYVPPYQQLKRFSEIFGSSYREQIANKTITHAQQSFFLGCMLRSRCAGERELEGTEAACSCLTQLIRLSNLTKDEREKILSLIVVNDQKVMPLQWAKDLADVIQQGPVGLEGVRAFTAQKTFQVNNVYEISEATRQLLDRYCAQGDEELLTDLIGYIEKDADLGKYFQDRDMMWRTLARWHSVDKQGAGDYILRKIVEHGGDSSEPNSTTLAVPLKAFYIDLLHALAPDQCEQEHLLFIKEINDKLLGSQIAEELLLGCARTISYYDRQSAYRTLSPEEHAIWLQSKITYQSVQASYFHGKRRVEGFLKIEVEAAEAAITKAYAVPLDFSSMVQAMDQAYQKAAKSPLPYNQLFYKQLKPGKEISIDVAAVGFLSKGLAIQIDTASGMVYNNGTRTTMLPLHLYEHDDIQLLGIQNLPYRWDADAGAFIYYNNSGDRQVSVKENSDGSLVIQKRFLDEEGDAEYRQYITPDRIALPKAARERLHIETFWMNRQGDIFGLNASGDCMACMVTDAGKQHLFLDVAPKALENAYHFIDQNFLDLNSNKTPFSILLGNFEPDEILVSADKKTCYIPAVQLTLTWTEEGLWRAERPGMGEKVMDVERSSESGAMIFKNYLNASEQELKNQLNKQKGDIEYRLTLKPTEGLSHVDHEKIRALKRELQTIQERLIALDEPILLQIGNFKGSLEVLSFRESSRESDQFIPADLKSILYPATKELSAEASRSLVQGLAGQSISQPLTDIERDFLKTAIEANQNSADPELYIALKSIELLDYMLLGYISATTIMNTPEELVRAEEIHAEYQKTLETVNEECKLLIPPISTHLLHLLLQTPVDITHIPSTPKSPGKVREIIKPEASLHLQAIASQNVLERCHASHLVTATLKSVDKEVEERKALIKSFQRHSPEQVTGYFLEELGLFNEATLLQEFSIPGSSAYIYRFTPEIIKGLFLFLEKKGYIHGHNTQLGYYSVSSPEDKEKAFDAQVIYAYLAPLGLTAEEKDRVVDKLQGFLVRATQSGFSFSFKPEAEQAIQNELEQLKADHLSKYLDAEAILLHEAAALNISFTDIKYALLSHDWERIPDEKRSLLRRAMVHYLFHKTELQHIQNIENAPMTGERNKIELLRTKRNYAVDLILEDADQLSPEQEAEQIRQLAFLAFEEDYGFRCNLMQIQIFRSLMLDSKEDEAIDAAQARMGFGKTALLPLLAIVQIAKERKRKIEERSFVRYVVPRAGIEDNTSSFNQRLQAILGSKVVKDREFARYQISETDPKASFTFMIADLQARFACYKNARSQGLAQIQWPEIRNSMEAQELELGQLLVEDKFTDPGVVQLCVQAKRLLSEMRSLRTYTVFDELDDTQDTKSREVNFTRGRKIPIPLPSIKPIQQLTTFIESHANDYEWNDKSARARQLVAAFCKDSFGNAIQAHSIDESVVRYLTSRSAPLTEAVKGLLSPALAQDLDHLPAENYTESDATFFLIRAILTDEHILSMMKSKLPSTHFGVRFQEKEGKREYSFDAQSQATLLIAVPYEGAGVSKGLSVYDNTEVAAITTLRYYASPETPLEINPHLNFLLKQVELDRIPPGLLSPNEQKIIAELKTIAIKLDPEDLKQEKEKFYAKYMNKEKLNKDFRSFFGKIVVATQIRADAASAKSNRYEMGSPEDVRKGCSGTVGGTSSYFDKQAEDPAADAKLSLEIMARQENSKIHSLEPYQEGSEKEYLDHTLDSILAGANADTRAIVDAAGICKSRDGAPETVVAELWKKLQADPLKTKLGNIEGIVYYGKDNVKRLYRGPAKSAIRCTTKMELKALAGKKYFSFYGQKQTRGSDIKQANGAHFLLTIDENDLNSDVKQAVLRYRGLVSRASKQYFSFAAMPQFTQAIVNTFTSDINARMAVLNYEISAITASTKEDTEAKAALLTQRQALTNRLAKITAGDWQPIASDVADFLRLEELRSIEKNALTDFNKEMEAHLKQAAAHMEAKYLAALPPELDSTQQAEYIRILKEREKICSFVEHTRLTLYSKYGNTMTSMERDAYITKQKSALFAGLEELETLYKQSIDFYEEQAERSIKQFKARFQESTPVETSSIDAQAQAVAMAQAQAEAQAATESKASALNLNEVLVENKPSRGDLPNLYAGKLPDINLDFLRDISQLPSAGTIRYLKPLIHPNQLQNIKVSPFITEGQPLATHFALVTADGYTAIFISQEEAELFKKGQNFDKFSLYDVRFLKKICGDSNALDEDLSHQMQCAVLGSSNIAADYHNLDTEALREHNDIYNATSEQLIPHLHVENLSTTQFSLPAFGVSKDGQVSAELQVGADARNFAILNTPFTLLQGNQKVNEAILRIDNGTEDQVQKLYDDISEQYDQVAGEIQAAQAEQAQLEKFLDEIAQKIDATPVIVLPSLIRAGLISRDSSATDNIGKYRGDEYAKLKSGKIINSSKIGAKAIQVFEEIDRIQKQIRQEKDRTKKELLFSHFKELLDQVIDDDTRLKIEQHSKNWAKDPLFSLNAEDTWSLDGQDDIAKVPESDLFRLMYTRIAALVHPNSIAGCVGCDRSDCRETFITWLPELAQILPVLQANLKAIDDISKQKKIVEEKIEKLNLQHKEIIEAKKFVNNFKAFQEQSEAALAGKGFHVAPGTFIDSFGLQQLFFGLDAIKATFGFSAPSYPALQGAQEYQAHLKGLTTEETEEVLLVRGFTTHILEESKKIIDRKGETDIAQVVAA